jgi:hypothetical protein
VTDCYYWLQYSPGGGDLWHSLKPCTSFIGQCAWYRTGTLPWPSKQPRNVVHFLIVALFDVALVAAGAIQCEYLSDGGIQQLPW